MTSSASIRRRPGLWDLVDLALLWVAKAGRRRLEVPRPFYDDFFSDHDLVKYQRDARNEWRFRRVADGIGQLDRESVKTVVDVGCGLGLFARYLPEDVRYVGVDLSETTLDRARRLANRDSVEFHATSFPRLALDEGLADVAVCLEVLEHVEDDAAAVRELARVIRPGGYLFVSVPHSYYWPSYLALIGHFRHYAARSFEEMLDARGFEVVRRFPMLSALWRIHHYAYVALRAWEGACRLAGRDANYSLYDSPAYALLARIVLTAAARREDRDDLESTFVLARRKDEPA